MDINVVEKIKGHIMAVSDVSMCFLAFFNIDTWNQILF